MEHRCKLKKRMGQGKVELVAACYELWWISCSLLSWLIRIEMAVYTMINGLDIDGHACWSSVLLFQGWKYMFCYPAEHLKLDWTSPTLSIMRGLGIGPWAPPLNKSFLMLDSYFFQSTCRDVSFYLRLPSLLYSYYPSAVKHLYKKISPLSSANWGCSFIFCIVSQQAIFHVLKIKKSIKDYLKWTKYILVLEEHRNLGIGTMW
jgi:hypothetical protein